MRGCRNDAGFVGEVRQVRGMPASRCKDSGLREDNMTCGLLVRVKKSNRHSGYPCLHCDEMFRVSQIQGGVGSLKILPDRVLCSECLPECETFITAFFTGIDRFPALGGIAGTSWVLRCPLGCVTNRGWGMAQPGRRGVFIAGTCSHRQAALNSLHEG